uniref:Secreted protein n=1 Tax=Triticum urartu TaxID=4572 RepID=A0A8R7U9K3_TRIUA
MSWRVTFIILSKSRFLRSSSVLTGLGGVSRQVSSQDQVSCSERSMYWRTWSNWASLTPPRASSRCDSASSMSSAHSSRHCHVGLSLTRSSSRRA